MRSVLRLIVWWLLMGDLKPREAKALFLAALFIIAATIAAGFIAWMVIHV